MRMTRKPKPTQLRKTFESGHEFILEFSGRSQVEQHVLASAKLLVNLGSLLLTDNGKTRILKATNVGASNCHISGTFGNRIGASLEERGSTEISFDDNGVACGKLERLEYSIFDDDGAAMIEGPLYRDRGDFIRPLDSYGEDIVSTIISTIQNATLEQIEKGCRYSASQHA